MASINEKCEHLVSQATQFIKSGTSDIKISLFFQGQRLDPARAIGEYTKEAEEVTVFALVHQISENARQSAYLHQETQVSDEFLMIIMSASQLKSDPNLISQELSALCTAQEASEEESKEKQDRISEEMEHMRERFGAALFPACIYSYTTSLFYSDLNRALATQQYTRVPHYLSTIIKQISYYHRLAHRDSSRPLYRGIGAGYVSLDTYKLHQHYFWTSFTSTSLNREVAACFAGPGGVIFKIHVAENKPFTNIQLPRSWSNFPDEEEVLLFPNFCFAVISKKKDEAGCTEVTVAEVPYQNFLDCNQFNFPRVVWLDLHIFNKSNSFSQRDLKRKLINIVFTKDEEKAKRELTTCNDCILITSGSLGQHFVPKVHDLDTVKGIAIYCLKISFHRKWAKQYPKVELVTGSVSLVIQWVIKRQKSLGKEDGTAEAAKTEEKITPTKK